MFEFVILFQQQKKKFESFDLFFIFHNHKQTA